MPAVFLFQELLEPGTSARMLEVHRTWRFRRRSAHHYGAIDRRGAEKFDWPASLDRANARRLA